MYINSSVETLEDHITVLTLHEALVHILHNASGVWLYNAYIMHSATRYLDYLSLQEGFDQLRLHTERVNTVVLRGEQGGWGVQWIGDVVHWLVMASIRLGVLVLLLG